MMGIRCVTVTNLNAKTCTFLSTATGLVDYESTETEQCKVYTNCISRYCVAYYVWYNSQIYVL